MSHHIYRQPGMSVSLGYDRTLNYVFCVVHKDGQIVYSNLDDPNAGTRQQDVEYFRRVLARLNVTVPEEMFTAVKLDQKQRVGNRVVNHSLTE